jgi:hypothetical protein
LSNFTRLLFPPDGFYICMILNNSGISSRII